MVTVLIESPNFVQIDSAMRKNAKYRDPFFSEILQHVGSVNFAFSLFSWQTDGQAVQSFLPRKLKDTLPALESTFFRCGMAYKEAVCSMDES